MKTVSWTTTAKQDLEEILFFIAASGRPETASRVGQSLRDALEIHVRSGGAGHPHAALPPGWQYIMHKRWMIAFESKDEAVIVRRVVDAARDLPELFGITT